MRLTQMRGYKGNFRFILVHQESIPSLKYSHHLQYSTEADFHSKAFSKQKIDVQEHSASPARSTALGTPHSHLGWELTTPQDVSLKEMTAKTEWERGGICVSNRGAHDCGYCCF